ncbi:Carbohydrate kinase, FGGY, N-terminal,Carbohydrate kinase, FGGY, C-terminal [Cinara cedri]|uniref:Carbohydrate kinase, FGGY, N-terminal,Carbohydrate kinase, FGGY, C-terminal n=1 Tax=Cinara cedri TaxID=506608 RepID=A0A5E4N5I9_9HEMI|nr:Carbohydrate kinase, FGGY, N-terminal,Carbohydrate kinase, FGGY, C-terminal [Cinara cedri]
MSFHYQFQAVGVLNVKSNIVSFTVVSAMDGHEVASSIKRMSLITKDSPGSCDRGIGKTQKIDTMNDVNEHNPTELPPFERGHVEQDPGNIWKTVMAVIEDTIDDMYHKGLPITYIKSVGITNEIGTLLVWHSETNEPLHNAIHWTDSRITHSNRGTASAIEWLLQNSPAVISAANKCRFGTLDTWLLWKLTAGEMYITDMTNASYTRLFDIATLNWDMDECRALGLAKCSWPTVHRRPNHYGIILISRLLGVTVNAVMARPNAALFGHRCYRSGQTVLTLDVLTSVAISSFGSQGRVPKPFNSPHKPWLVVGYWEPNEPYPVLGMATASEANVVMQWLKNNYLMSVEECINTYANAHPSSQQAILVPAFGGLPMPPYGRPNARPAIIGISKPMGHDELITMVVESLCYSAADIVQCSADGRPTDTVFIDGPYSNFGPLTQRLSDVLGTRLIRNRCDMAIDGVARMVASTINLKYRSHHEIIVYDPISTAEQRLVWSKMWKEAIRRSDGWAAPEEDEFTPSRFCRNTVQTVKSCAIGWVKWIKQLFIS